MSLLHGVLVKRLNHTSHATITANSSHHHHHNKTTLKSRGVGAQQHFSSNVKEDTSASINTEFTNGYHIRFWELVIVVFVIALWLASLWRFIKSFDMLRITHHREIPYKYRIREHHGPSLSASSSPPHHIGPYASANASGLNVHKKI